MPGVPVKPAAADCLNDLMIVQDVLGRVVKKSETTDPLIADLVDAWNAAGRLEARLKELIDGR